MKKKDVIQALIDNRMTILNFKMEVINEFHSIGLVTRSDEGRQYRLMLELIDQIYNDHEEQLKAKDEEIEKLKKSKECLEIKLYGKVRKPFDWLKDNK